ncbi:hypothetical protein GVX82_00755 [Patescibacteria group bacterium]|jgi:hypothetical protein|nr:hypothetical protein [Patescibacteria group bacterium]
MEFILSLLPLAIVSLVIYRVTLANTGFWQAIEEALDQSRAQERARRTSSSPENRGDDLRALLARFTTHEQERSTGSHQARRTGAGTGNHLRTALFIILSCALLYLLTGAPALDLLREIARALVGA